MEIEVEITREDYWRLNAFFMNRTFRTRWLHWATIVLAGVVLLLLGVLLALGGDLSFLAEPSNVTLLALIGGLAVLVVGLQVLLKIWIKRLPRDGAGTLGRHRIVLEDDAVFEQTDVSEGRHAWSAVTEVCQDAHAIYLFIDRMQAHIVPKRAFADARAATSFYETAHARWRQATRRAVA